MPFKTLYALLFLPSLYTRADLDMKKRFKDKELASIKSTKFPKHFSEKVDLRKVNISVLRPWVAEKVTELIKVEDDIVVEYVFGMLEDRENPVRLNHTSLYSSRYEY